MQFNDGSQRHIKTSEPAQWLCWHGFVIPKRTVNFKFDSFNQTKDEIKQKTQDFFNNIYDKIKTLGNQTPRNNNNNNRTSSDNASSKISNLLLNNIFIHIFK